MIHCRNCFLALVLGICTPILIWVGLGSAIYQSFDRRRTILKVGHSQT